MSASLLPHMPFPLIANELTLAIAQTPCDAPALWPVAQAAAPRRYTCSETFLGCLSVLPCLQAPCQQFLFFSAIISCSAFHTFFYFVVCLLVFVFLRFPDASESVAKGAHKMGSCFSSALLFLLLGVSCQPRLVRQCISWEPSAS